jgi:ribonuclease HIII
MVAVEDYVARIEETCGEEKDFIVIFKYDKKDDAIAKILKKAKMEKSISNIIFELKFKGVSFRLYGTGKAIFRNLKSKSELHNLLTELL